MRADVVGNIAQRQRQPERNAPAPVHHEGGIGAPHREHERGQKRTDQQARGRGGRHHGAVEAAMIVRCVLRDKRGRTGVLASRRERLHHAQQQQQQRRAHAQHGIARQAADEERSAAHEQDRHRQCPLAALLVAHVAPKDCADGAHEEREGEHAEGHHDGYRVVIVGEEHQRDNSGKVGIARVVEPLDEVTEEGRPRHLAQNGMLLRLGSLGVGGALHGGCVTHGNHPPLRVSNRKRSWLLLSIMP